MKSPARVSLVLVLVLVLLVATRLGQPPPPPLLFDGKPVSAWALDLNSPSATARDKAAETIHRFDSNAVPALVHLLRTPNPPLARLARLIARCLPARAGAGLIRMVDPFAAPAKRASSAQALKIMGPKARAALPALSRALDDEDTVSWFAALTLAQFGEAGVTALTNGLVKITSAHTDFLCYALSTQGPAASNAIPALAVLLEKGPQERAEKAATALASIGKASVPVLSRCLENPSPRVRVLAAQALGSIGPVARETIPKLIDRAKASTPAERRAALQALALIRPNAESVTATLADALQDSSREVRLEAVHGLARSPSDNSTVQSALIGALGDESADVRGEAVDALGQIGKTQPAAIAALRQTLQDPSETVRTRARQALERLSAVKSK